MSPARSLAERYHEATKYTPQSVRAHAGLDFRAQPSPFKEWYQARRVALEGAPPAPPRPSPGPLTAERLGRILYHTYGVTLVREFPGMSMHYRASPSAGGLYPTELYVATRGIGGIPDGIHDYQAKDHSLAVGWEGDFGVDLARFALGHPAMAAARAVLVATGVYERSAWRYRDRAYRRILLDTGHVFGNAVLAAACEGLAVVPVPDFVDDGIDGLLLLDPRREGTLLLGAIVEDGEGAAAGRAARRSPVHADAPEPEEGAWIPAVHDAARIAELSEPLPGTRDPAGPSAVGAPVPLPAEPLEGGAPVLQAIRRRRSARRLAGDPVPLEAVGRMLAHAHPRPGSPDPVAPIAPDVLEVFVVVSAVPELPPGVYRYDARAHALVPIRRGNPRQALYEACLQQDLGRDAALTVVHAADLPAAVARYGERAYRAIHLEAGLLGERLDLAAQRLGYGASGIGGFFDEFVNSLLLLPPSYAVAYLTTIGVPA